jgi:hypothetical protein
MCSTGTHTLGTVGGGQLSVLKSVIQCVMSLTQLQDAWDWMSVHWCDRNQGLWPFKQMANPPLELYRPAQYLGAVYTRLQKQSPGSQRAQAYAALFRSFRSGHDPHNEIGWDVVQLLLLCFQRVLCLRNLCSCCHRQYELHQGSVGVMKR